MNSRKRRTSVEQRRRAELKQKERQSRSASSKNNEKLTKREKLSWNVKPRKIESARKSRTGKQKSLIGAPWRASVHESLGGSWRYQSLSKSYRSLKES